MEVDAGEAAALDGASVRREDAVDGADAPALLGAPSLLVVERAEGQELLVGEFHRMEGGVVEETEGSEGPEVAPPGGEDAGPDGVFDGEEGEDGDEEAVREGSKSVEAVGSDSSTAKMRVRVGDDLSLLAPARRHGSLNLLSTAHGLKAGGEGRRNRGVWVWVQVALDGDSFLFVLHAWGVPVSKG